VEWKRERKKRSKKKMTKRDGVYLCFSLGGRCDDGYGWVREGSGWVGGRALGAGSDPGGCTAFLLFCFCFLPRAFRSVCVCESEKAGKAGRGNECQGRQEPNVGKGREVGAR
jgi:hypothetical protein